MIRCFVKSACDLVYPKHCVVCRRHIPLKKDPYHLCLFCQSKVKQSPPVLKSRLRKKNFDSIYGILSYSDEMKRILHLFKYGNKLVLRHFLSSKVFRYVNQHKIDLSSYDYLVPVPLHPVRLRERGYNQSEIIAHMISQKSNVPVSRNNLIRAKNTQFQASLSPKKRFTNIKGAFRIKAPYEFQNKRILLIDDLFTTGATASEASQELKSAKAKKIDILTLALAHNQ